MRRRVRLTIMLPEIVSVTVFAALTLVGGLLVSSQYRHQPLFLLPAPVTRRPAPYLVPYTSDSGCGYALNLGNWTDAPIAMRCGRYVLILWRCISPPRAPKGTKQRMQGKMWRAGGVRHVQRHRRAAMAVASRSPYVWRSVAGCTSGNGAAGRQVGGPGGRLHRSQSCYWAAPLPQRTWYGLSLVT
jgi:hypothetical protein